MSKTRHFYLYTFGRIALVSRESDGERLILGPVKPLAALIFLLTFPGRTVLRGRLIDLLWSDRDLKSGEHGLRQVLWRLRRLLGKNAIRSDDRSVTLESDIPSDRGKFLAAIEAGEWECALDVHAGDFLSDFAVPGGAEFEHWIDLERERLLNKLQYVGESAVTQHLGTGRFERAHRIAVRARDAAPARQRLWCLVMETCVARGDDAAARMTADGLDVRLRDDGIEASPATRELMHRVRSEAVAPFGDGDAQWLRTELVGRTVEFHLVLDNWKGARRGTGRHLHFAAPAGLGKTRLLDDLHGRLRAGGARTVHVVARAGEREFDLAFLSEIALALGSLSGARGVSPRSAAVLAALHPVLADHMGVTPATPQRNAERYHLTALIDLLAAVTEDGPIAILLDDLHWSDPGSLRLVAGVLGRVCEHAALVITAARPTPQVEEWLSPGAQRVDLPSLSVSEIEAMLTSIAGFPDQPWAAELPRALHRASGGIPLLVLESVKLAIDSQRLARAGDEWQCVDAEALFADFEQGSAMRHRITTLERSDQYVLLVLSVASMPVDDEVLHSILSAATGVSSHSLAALERSGFIHRIGSSWSVAHDEIADTAVSSASAEARRAAHRDLGRALAGQSFAGPHVRKRAARHLASAGEHHDLATLFVEHLRTIRPRSNAPTLAQIAGELLGVDGRSADSRRLVRSAPLLTRLGYGTRRRAVLMGPAVLFVLMVPFVAGDSSPADVEHSLAVFRRGEHGFTEVRVIPVDPPGWESRSAPLSVADVPPVQLPTNGALEPPKRSPSGDLWAFVRNGRYGSPDLFVVDRHGNERQLTDSPSDNAGYDWSPDGRHIAFRTQDGRSQPGYDLSIVDVETGVVRALAVGPESVSGPRWSPDGTQVAFTQSYADGSAAPCVVTFDGRSLRCFRPGVGSAALGAEAWYDISRLIVFDLSDFAVRWILDTVDWTLHFESESSQPVMGGQPSRSGRWIARFAVLEGTVDPVWIIHPIRSPDRTRTINIESVSDVEVRWMDRTLPYLDRVRIRNPHSNIPFGTPYQLQAEGFDQFGAPFPLRDITWHVGDSSVASLDGARIVPRRLGRVALSASADGWRADTTTVAIVASTWHQLEEELWAGGVTGRWRRFGSPLPDTVRVNGGLGVALRGDSLYTSGFYLQKPLPAHEGLGFEATISTPLTGAGWQDVRLRFAPDMPAELLSWDHRTGGLPLIVRPEWLHCGLEYPFRRRLTTTDSALVHPSQVERLALDPVFANGGLHRVAVQILPDGSCAVAVDGVARWRSERTLDTNREYRIVLDGASHHTTIAIGEIRIWRGVHPEYDWFPRRRR